MSSGRQYDRRGLFSLGIPQSPYRLRQILALLRFPLQHIQSANNPLARSNPISDETIAYISPLD